MTPIVPFAVFVVVLAATRASAGDAFVGKWVNVDDKTSGLIRIEVSKQDKGWTIQAWGAGGRGEIDQGKVALRLLRDSAADTTMKYGFAPWDHKFKETHLTLRLEKDRLIVVDFNIFTNDSGRSNYRSRYGFKKAKWGAPNQLLMCQEVADVTAVRQ